MTGWGRVSCREESDLEAICDIPLDSTLRLSSRQREVLEWAAIGKTDWEIGKILSISERAVKFHLEKARQRLDASNRTHAVARAISLGLIDPGSSTT